REATQHNVTIAWWARAEHPDLLPPIRNRQPDGLPPVLRKAYQLAPPPIGRPTAGWLESKANHPCVGPPWWGAKRYCRWLSIVTGHFYRLPTEAEWEYVCSAAGTLEYPCGATSDCLDETAWTIESKYEGAPEAQPTGTKKPSKLGFFDLAG